MSGPAVRADSACIPAAPTSSSSPPGVPGLIRAEHVREGAVVLDVGISQVADPMTGAGRLVGDVDFDAVAPRVRAITPVPGGIGPVTDVWVIRNTVASARNATRPRPRDRGPFAQEGASSSWPPLH